MVLLSFDVVLRGGGGIIQLLEGKDGNADVKNEITQPVCFYGIKQVKSITKVQHKNNITPRKALAWHCTCFFCH